MALKLKQFILREINYYERKYRFLAYFRYAIRFIFFKKHKLPNKLIVSLTSYPPRFTKLHLTVKTLLSQSINADLVVLWIFKKDFEKLPKKVRKLEGHRFQIQIVENDIKSYKKLVPALKLFPNAYIIKADDDVFYDFCWIESLISQHIIGEKEILGHRGHLIKLCSNGLIAPYSQWEWETNNTKKSPYIFLTGVGGILYPPQSLHSDVSMTNEFMSICPRCDDVWFYFMAHKNGFMSRRVIGNFSGYTWGGTQDVALFNSNVAGGANDRAMQAMILKYGSPL